MDKEKKMKAAVSTVLYYLQEEKERGSVSKQQEHANQPSVWAHFSRQMIMINRDRFQRRTIKR